MKLGLSVFPALGSATPRGALLLALLAWSLCALACAPADTSLDAMLDALAQANDQAEERGRRCHTGEAAACTALHTSCMTDRHRRSCDQLSSAPVEQLDSNRATFDHPKTYLTLSCLDQRNKLSCERLLPSGRPSAIRLGLSDERLAEVTAKATRPKPPSPPVASVAPKGPATALGPLSQADSPLARLFKADAGAFEFAGAFDELVVRAALKRMCDGGDADACITFASRQGSAGNSCGFGCSDLIREANDAVRRGHDLHQQACRKGEPRHCYKMALWRQRFTGSSKTRLTDERLRQVNEGFHEACRLGLIDGCNAATARIRRFQRGALVNPSSHFRQELHRDSHKACQLAQDPAAPECASYLFVLIRDAPVSQRSSVRQRAAEFGLDALFEQLAYWEHPAYRVPP